VRKGRRASIVALVAAGIALVRKTGAPRLVLALLALSALPTAWHVPPFGQAGLALLHRRRLAPSCGGNLQPQPPASLGEPALALPEGALAVTSQGLGRRNEVARASPCRLLLPR
jgi:hypothetical protein